MEPDPQRQLTASGPMLASISWLQQVRDLVAASVTRDCVPAVAGGAVVLAGVINVASVATVELPARLHALLAFVPASDVEFAHALALPAGVGLLGVGWPLARRRRAALDVAVGLLILLGLLDVVKGLDVQEAGVSWGLAVLLWRGRAAFWVLRDRDGVRSACARAALLLLGSVLVATVTVALASAQATTALSFTTAPVAALSLLAMSGGPAFRAPLAWLPEAIGALGAATALSCAAVIFAPSRLKRLGRSFGRLQAARLVRLHGDDTLSAFKLRSDVHRRFSPDGRAVVAYRVAAGSLLVAGDPVGPPDALPEVIEDLLAHAHRHGLAVGAVGASQRFAAVASEAGLRSLYLGDEAILAAGPLDLTGRPMKNLRNAIRRLERHGYTAELREVGDLAAPELEELEAVSERWRHGAPERGFSMAHDVLSDDLLPEALVVVAKDDAGRARGFLHFVPVFGRPMVSLAFMRRDLDTPNGLTEFLVVRAAALLGELGVEELSLNFAACGRWLREPATRGERALAHLLRATDRWFQVERLLRFNEKFRPRWQPRYLLYEGRLGLPRALATTLLVEGHVPLPALPTRPRRGG